MGKHERDWAEAAEQAVCDVINGLPGPTHAVQVAKAIGDFANGLIGAEWKGRSNYSHGGDVLLQLVSGKKQLCELKFSADTGSGTAKNLGARTFCKRVSTEILGYKEYDYDQGYQRERYQLVEGILGRTVSSARDYQSSLRTFRTTQPDVLDTIAAITAPGQVAYAEYASLLLNSHLPAVNQLAQSILPISGTRPADENMLYCVTKNWQKPNQTTEFYDFKDMDTKIVKVRSSGKSILFCNQHDRTVLTFSVHWKNICQGGATPCFNVFFGNALR